MQKQQLYQKELVQILVNIHKPSNLNAFLTDLLSSTEFHELAVRWQIVKQLSKGVPQRVIAKTLGVGIATVTRGARILTNPNSGFKQELTKVQK